MTFVFSKGPRQHQLSAARHSEQGGARLKAFVFTAVLLFAVYATVKILPSYIAEYELHDKMQEAARFSVVNHYTEEQIKDNIYKVVQDLEIPAKRDDIKVVSSMQIVKISMDYTVPIDLLVYHVDLHFSPSSENKSLLSGM
jgi:hypothetical protein